MVIACKFISVSTHRQFQPCMIQVIFDACTCVYLMLSTGSVTKIEINITFMSEKHTMNHCQFLPKKARHTKQFDQSSG